MTELQDWTGGEQPTTKPVDVVYRKGPNAIRKNPDTLRWSHIGARDDIMQWRESPEKSKP